MSSFCNFWKVRKSNFSKTRENKKFGNFCLTQGLKECYRHLKHCPRPPLIRVLKNTNQLFGPVQSTNLFSLNFNKECWNSYKTFITTVLRCLNKTVTGLGKGSSINDIMVLEGRGCCLCDDSAKTLVIKRSDDGVGVGG